MEIHFVSLRFEPALGKNLFNDSADLPFFSVLCEFTKVAIFANCEFAKVFHHQHYPLYSVNYLSSSPHTIMAKQH